MAQEFSKFTAELTKEWGPISLKHASRGGQEYKEIET